MKKQTKFNLRPEHIKLLRKACIEWYTTEFGAPGINCKRPYGNSKSGIYEDIAEAIGIEPKINDEGKKFTDSQIRYMDDLHAEMFKALEIILQLGEIEPGQYEATGYLRIWKKSGEV